MKKSHILVSIIIPIYNADSYLVKCVESVINQTYTNLEIILVNDGSTDNSVEIINSFVSSDLRIKFFDKENGGIGSAYKVAFENMSGDYVLFVDSDDWLELNAVEDLLQLALANDADMVSFGIKAQDTNGQTLELKTFDNIDLVNTTNESVLKTHFEVLKHPTLVRLYKAHLFKDITVFEQNIGIDEMLTPQLLVKCNRVVYTSAKYYNVLVRTDSVCRSAITPEKVMQVIKVYKFVIDFFKQNIAHYEHLFQMKYLNILHGYFYEAFGTLDYSTYSKLVNEIKYLSNSVALKGNLANNSKRQVFLSLIIKLPTTVSFHIINMVKRFAY